MTTLPHLRFAVGSFDSWAQLCKAAAEMEQRGLTTDRFNYVAQRKMFTDAAVYKRFVLPGQVEYLAFPEGRPICCTSGALANCLSERVGAGARTFQEALGQWLLPRHASHFQAAVDKGRILAWIEFKDASDERNACQVLLADSSNLVGVHDLMPTFPAARPQRP